MSEPSATVDRDHGLELLGDMIFMRRFEEKCAELYSAGKIRGFMHLYIGEEAVAVGAMRALTKDDAVVSHYRDHGHALARGISADRVMAEMFGKREGCSGGRGGSMHLFDASNRFYGGHAIVAAGVPVAVGLALADKMQSWKNVTIAIFGDGATAEGVFYESLNLAALWKVPVLFLCENNLYAMGTALSRYDAQTDLSRKAESQGVPAAKVDGMDVIAVEDAVSRAVDSIRCDGSPRFLEVRTFRFRAHSMFDSDRYRDKAEIEQWKQRDPIAVLRARMQSAGSLADVDIARLETSAAERVATAVAFAEAGTLEDVKELTRHVYAGAVGS